MAPTIRSRLRNSLFRRQPTVILARTPRAADPYLPSFSRLADELVLHIIEIVHVSSPQDLFNVALVCSDLYVKARCLQHRLLALDFPRHTKITLTSLIFEIWSEDSSPGRVAAHRLQYMQRIDLLSAIRTLDVSIPSVGGEPLSVQQIAHANKTRQWKFLRKPKTPSQDPGMDQMVKRYPIWPLAFGQYHPNPSCLSSTPLINSIPDLRDIHWHCWHVHSALSLPDTFSFLITNSKSPPINLHLSITTRDDRRPNPRLLQLLSQLLTYPLTPNLTSIKINITYYTQNYTRQILHPLKAILCYAPICKSFLSTSGTTAAPAARAL